MEKNCEKKIKVSREMIAEFKDRVMNKMRYKPGDIFTMFGVEYQCCESACCCDCAFYEAQCDLNVDIPTCNNDVHFEKI